jgi:hypothetical protein
VLAAAVAAALHREGMAVGVALDAPTAWSAWRSAAMTEHVAQRPYLVNMRRPTPNSFSSAHENIGSPRWNGLRRAL